MTTYNVTNTFAIELSNAQIDELAKMGRYAAMKFLGVNESRARKIIEAIKSGEIKKSIVAERSADEKVVALSGIAFSKNCMPTNKALELFNVCKTRDDFVNRMIQAGANMKYAVRQYLRAHRFVVGYMKAI